ncbi:MAG: pantoate--beta-alanine ligase, partial [Candidatus Omnitrophica bacterium]|nr:pantoate--beta-alanine ligase [Candidatus Omnitrophota bacterium]
VWPLVSKLFNIVLPDLAVFGAKDFQQAAIVQRMVRDLNFPVRIIVAPTKREPDGLAMSSRNAYLSLTERHQGTVLWQAICEARRVVRAATGAVKAKALRRRLMELIERQPAARVDYLEFFDPATLRPVEQVQPGSHMALAVFIGRTRLIDNATIR